MPGRVATLLAAVLLVAAPLGAREKPAAAGEKVTFRSGKDTVRAVQYRPEGKGPFPAVVVIHGDFGLTPWVQKQARRLADKGYLTLAVDLYRGELPKDVEEAHILERGLPENQVFADLKAAADFAFSRPEAAKGRLGVIGWDMGGGYALDAALHDPRVTAAVVCYGRLTTDPKALAKLNGPVLGLFAGKDEGIPPETIKQFQRAMQKAGKHLAGPHVYADAESGFMDPNSPYLTGPPDAKLAADAWAKIEAFFAAELKR